MAIRLKFWISRTCWHLIVLWLETDYITRSIVLKNDRACTWIDLSFSMELLLLASWRIAWQTVSMLQRLGPGGLLTNSILVAKCFLLLERFFWTLVLDMGWLKPYPFFLCNCSASLPCEFPELIWMEYTQMFIALSLLCLSGFTLRWAAISNWNEVAVSIFAHGFSVRHWTRCWRAGGGDEPDPICDLTELHPERLCLGLCTARYPSPQLTPFLF